MKNSIEEDITKINTYIELILEKDYCNCNELNTILGKHCDGSKNVAYAMQHILSDYKRVLKENEIYKKNSEIMSKENLSTAEQLKVEIKENFRLKNQLENNRKEYQETYKDVREELKELKKENEILKKEKEQAWEEWNNLEQGSYETEQKLKQQIKELRKENEECKLDVQDYLKQAQENAEMYRKAQKKIQDLKAENEELKNNTRKNENELEFDIDCDWIALQKMLDESEKSNEYISYKNEKWIKEKYCIPIQKVKGKIEELDIAISECIYLDDDDKAYKKAVKKDKLCLLNQKRALQELLEEGDLE